ncbi:MAG: hypothetical protein V2B20_06755 [Pseudomonadota bacterium]
MKRIAIFLIFAFFISIIASCGNKEIETAPSHFGSLAVFTIADKERKQLSPDDQRELHRVMTWLNRDIVDLLRDNSFEVVLLNDMKNYSSSMGPLFIINFEFFDPGATASLPQGRMGSPISSIDLKYKILDERGALLAEWQDGEHSIKGGTYCARTLNRRAITKIVDYFAPR